MQPRMFIHCKAVNAVSLSGIVIDCRGVIELPLYRAVVQGAESA